MKKSYYLIVLALILGLVLTGCSLLSNVGQVPTTEQSGITYLTKGTPKTITLYAGQHIDVGSVKVWNDGVNLYIKYKTTGGWEMAETHLYVGKTDPNELTSAPGQFPYSEDHDPAVPTFTYTIPISDIDSYSLSEKGKKWVADENTGGIDPDYQLYIAAHAVVVQYGCYETVWQIGDVETIDLVTGQLTCYYDELNRDESAVNPWPTFTNPFVIGITPDNEFPYNSNYAYLYATDFNVDWNGNLPFGGRLILSWSPGKSSALETKIITSLDSGETATFTEKGDTSLIGWKLYKLVESTMTLNPIESGPHEFRFQTTSGDGTFWDWVRLEKVCEETAWADGTDFDGKNWATYFTYTVQGGYLAELIPAVDMFPGSVYDNIYQIPEAEGKVTVIQPTNNNVTLTVSADGLAPISKYKVFFDTNGVTQDDVTTAGPWSFKDTFWTDGEGHGVWTYNSAGSLGGGSYTWAVAINQTFPKTPATVLISYNIEFNIN
jgi:hypothetical protein